MVLGGRYEVGRLVGAGGVSSVHAARDLLLGREVAIKLFRRDAQAGPELRLQQIEARLGAAMNHYALTTLFDAGVDAAPGAEPQIYLVMEFIRGQTLRERLRQGPLEIMQACWLGFDLAEALQYMHRTGFLHRDVKPANILIADTGSVRPVMTKLTDFGIATPIGQPDLSEYTVGTAAYLSPEQVEGEDARPASDVYALGLVLLEAMTGTVAFPGTVEQSAFARLDRDPEIPAHIPAAVADLLARMTRRSPADRVGLHQVAVELQQSVIDDLIRRRTAGHPAIADPSAASNTTTSGSITATSATAPDETLDRLTRLVSGTLVAAAAVVILEHGGTLAVAARYGRFDGADEIELPGDLNTRGTTAPWVIEDADTAPSGLFASAYGMRSAVGVPLLAHDQQRLGWLIVLDASPRRFAETEIPVVADFAAVIAHELELRAAARRAMFAES